jgi:hypothetical protein
MLPYYPALRFKQGEYNALANIADDIRSHIQPRLIIPPPKERDPEKGSPLTAEEIAHVTGSRIGRHWPLAPAFLDTQYVAGLLGENGVANLIRRARSINPRLAAVITIADLFRPHSRHLFLENFPRAAIHVPYEMFDGALLLKGIGIAGLSPEDCLLFLDFSGAPWEVDGIAGSVAALFDQLASLAQWGRIVFQGSAYPKINPAQPGSSFLVLRGEWTTYRSALEEFASIPGQIAYGDFGADCSEIVFPRKNGAIPIRHLRYTTTDATYVVRGAQSVDQKTAMRDVCQRICQSDHFAGRAFSYADDRIAQIALGASGGTPSQWRELNTAHHMTRVVRDLGAMVGISFTTRPVEERHMQEQLFADANT